MWCHIKSHDITCCCHVVSRGCHMVSRGVTWGSHRVSHGVTWCHMGARGVTWCHGGGTWCHMLLHLALHSNSLFQILQSSKSPNITLSQRTLVHGTIPPYV